MPLSLARRQPYALQEPRRDSQELSTAPESVDNRSISPSGQRDIRRRRPWAFKLLLVHGGDTAGSDLPVWFVIDDILLHREPGPRERLSLWK